MFSENTVMLYQQDLQLGTDFVKWQLSIDQGFPRFPMNYFAKYLKWPKFLGWSRFPRIYGICFA